MFNKIQVKVFKFTIIYSIILLKLKGESNMILIDKITDEDLNEKSTEMLNPRIRYGARGIVIRNDGKIAVFNKSKKNEYKLPGGGIEENEK